MQNRPGERRRQEAAELEGFVGLGKGFGPWECSETQAGRAALVGWPVREEGWQGRAGGSSGAPGTRVGSGRSRVGSGLLPVSEAQPASAAPVTASLSPAPSPTPRPPLAASLSPPPRSVSF